MTLKAVVTDLNAVPEELRGFYKETDGGKHVLNVEPVDGLKLENVDSLKSAYESEKDARRKANEKLTAFDGIDAVAAREALATAERFKGLDPEKDAERIASEKLNGMKAQLQAEFDEKIKPYEAENISLKSALIQDKVDTLATQAITAANGSVELLMPIIKGKTKAEFIDGKVVVSVVGDDGKPRIKDHVNNVMLGVDDLVAELRSNDAYGGAFKANGGGSGGTPLKHGAPETQKPDAKGTRDQQAAHYAKKHNLPVR